MRPIVTRTTGGISSTLNWTFNPNATNTETHITVDVEYDIPLPLIGKLAENLVNKINEADLALAFNFLMMKFNGRSSSP